MKITKILAAVGLLSLAGTAASAATFQLADANDYGSVYRVSDGITMNVYGTNHYRYVSQHTNAGYGLSVRNHMINGHEGVVLGFSERVYMSSVYAGYVDSGDSYRLYGYGAGGWTALDSGSYGSGSGWNSSRATVEFAGQAPNRAYRWFWLRNGTDGHTDIKLRSVSVVSEVPLPAGGVLLLSALGLMAWRRKKA